MESIISYIVIITLIVISIYVYNIRKQQTRLYVLSIQNYPELIMIVNIKKLASKIEDIVVQIKSKVDIEICDLRVELITSKREFNHYELNSFCNIDNALPIKIVAGSNESFTISFDAFKELLSDGQHPFRTYRFVVYDNNNKPYKSHELGFNKKWVIYRPDSGSYN